MGYPMQTTSAEPKEIDSFLALSASLRARLCSAAAICCTKPREYGYLSGNGTKRWGRLVLVIAVLLPAGHPAVATAQDDALTDELRGLVGQYFKSDSPSGQQKIASQISRLDGISIKQVAQAIRNTQLWAPHEAGVQKFKITCEREHGKRPHEMQVHARVPEGYDHERRYPLLLAFHGRGGQGERYLAFAESLLGDQADEYIIAAPTDYQGVWFGSDEDETNDIHRLLDTLKKRYHIDSDRIYASGYSMGGHASFVLSALHTDYFAAAIPLAGTFALQFSWEAIDLMLPNIKPVAVLVVYGELDHDQEKTKTDQYDGISGANRYVAAAAQRLGVDVEMIELAGVGHVGVRPPTERFLAYLNKSRPQSLKQFDHWFRYQAQGRMAWLRQTRFLGTPWTGQRLVIRPAKGESMSDATISVLKDKLAFIGGRIDGQSIYVYSRRCSKMELLLNSDLVDLERDITIYLNDTKRFTGRAEPRIGTLLQDAQKDWDFQRLWPVRFELSHKGLAVQR